MLWRSRLLYNRMTALDCLCSFVLLAIAAHKRAELLRHAKLVGRRVLQEEGGGRACRESGQRLGGLSAAAAAPSAARTCHTPHGIWLRRRKGVLNHASYASLLAHSCVTLNSGCPSPLGASATTS